MLERRTSIVQDGNITRKVFTSAPDQVSVELSGKTSDKITVRLTPLPGFTKDDYLVEVTYGDDGFIKSFRKLFGTLPNWGKEATEWQQACALHDAKLIVSPTVGA